MEGSDGTVETFTVKTGSFGDTTGLPEAHPGVFNIVSRIVAEANPTRTDLLMTFDLVRDADGKPIGCKGFSSLHGLDANAADGTEEE